MTDEKGEKKEEKGHHVGLLGSISLHEDGEVAHQLEESIRLSEKRGRTRYFVARKKFLRTPPALPNLFGGQIMSQALYAAYQTVVQAFNVHSFHGYFIMPGHTNSDITYRVRTVRDGRSFCTRSIDCLQDGQVIFQSMCSFCVDDLRYGQRFAEPIPDIAITSDFLNFPSYEQAVFADLLEMAMKAQGGSKSAEQDSLLQTRFHLESKLQGGPTPLDLIPAPVGTTIAPRVVWWVKTKFPIHDKNMSTFESQTMHRTILMHMSDSNIAIPCIGVLGGWAKAQGIIGTLCSLDHAIWFHDADVHGAEDYWRADDWLFFDGICFISEANRCTVHVKVWSMSTRHLIASFVQELLIRITPAVKMSDGQKPDDSKQLRHANDNYKHFGRARPVEIPKAKL